jgi:hypothetical protein
MQYYEWLFDEKRILDKNPHARGESSSYLEKTLSLIASNSAHIKALAKSVTLYLNTSLRRWVDLKQIFSFAKMAI